MKSNKRIVKEIKKGVDLGEKIYCLLILTLPRETGPITPTNLHRLQGTNGAANM